MSAEPALKLPVVDPRWMLGPSALSMSLLRPLRSHRNKECVQLEPKGLPGKMF